MIVFLNVHFHTIANVFFALATIRPCKIKLLFATMQLFLAFYSLSFAY